MKNNNKISDIFSSIYRDGKILFVILAALLISTSYVINFSNIPSDNYFKEILIGVTFSFSWVLIAWAITDKSILRKPWLYIGIFVAFFIEKIYWTIFYNLYPPYAEINSEIADAYAVGLPNIPRPSYEWIQLQESASYLLIIITFILMIIVFIILWYLSRPRDFIKNNIVSKKRASLVIITAILMTAHIWIWRLLVTIGGQDFSRFIVENIDMIHWYEFLFEGIPLTIALIILAIVITNIKSKSKYFLYGIIGLPVIILHMPWYRFFDFITWDNLNLSLYTFIIFSVCYFLIFLGFVLLSKTKYIEQ